MYRYSISLLLLLLACFEGQAQDTTAVKHTERKLVPAAGHQLRVSIDVGKPVINSFSGTTKNYEAAIDYYFKNELYFVAEGGFGNATLDYTDLSYKTSSSFVRVGVDKCMLQRIFPKDWDMAFAGLRYGFGTIRRGDASYQINDSLWGPSSGVIAGRNFTAHWAELLGGVRVELYKGIIAGWNVRAKFLLNSKAFRDLSPAYISGYGKGDKTTAFDFNFYLCYALRWGNHTASTLPAP